MGGFIVFFVVVCIACYVIGSIPFAFLVLKKRHGKTIMSEGSGNVGAMNSFDVTGSKSTGIIVFFLDFLKGFIPVCIMVYILHFDLSLILLPAALLVLGHNYSIFLKFKGGRGLATAAGASIPINFLLIIIWCLGFLLTFAIKRNVHWANVGGTILLPVIAFIFSGFLSGFTYGYTDISGNAVNNSILKELLFVFSSSICLIILLKHINPIVELLKKPKSNE
jgi:acyl phosphate:glycerol-3-phosphate acyltransferase